MLSRNYTVIQVSFCLGGVLVAWFVYAFSLLPYVLALIVGTAVVLALWGEDLTRQRISISHLLSAGGTVRNSEGTEGKMPQFSIFQRKSSSSTPNTRNNAPATRVRTSATVHQNQSILGQKENSRMTAASPGIGNRHNGSSLSISFSGQRSPGYKFSDSGSNSMLSRTLGSPAMLNRTFQGLNVADRRSEAPMPKVQRVTQSPGGFGYNSSISGRPPLVGHRRYPTHQPKYDMVGILPAVKLHSPGRAVLSENHSMISPVTVKVAPPDVLKQTTPTIIHVTPRSQQGDGVVTALREKRKRHNLEEEETSESQTNNQDSKRRRQNQIDQQASNHTRAGENMEEGTSRAANKRPADSDPESDTEDDNAPKRVRTESETNASTDDSSCQGIRNPIEISYSSSRRWLERQKLDDGSSSETSNHRVTRSQSRERSLPRTEILEKRTHNIPVITESTPHSSSGRNTPIRLGQALRDLKDDDEPMLDRGTAICNTPIAGSSGRSSPSFANTGSELDDSFSKSNTKKRLVLLKKEGSSKRRLTPLHSDIADKLSKLPQLRYSLTVEDFEKDRLAERERVKQMMDDIEEAHKQQLEKKAKQSESSVAKTTAESTNAKSVSNIAASLTTSTTLTASGSATTLSTGFKLPTPASTTGSNSASAAASIASVAPSVATATMKPSPAGTGTTTSAASSAVGGFKFGESIKSTAPATFGSAPKDAGETNQVTPATSNTANSITAGSNTTANVSKPNTETVTLFTHKPTTTGTADTPKTSATEMFAFGNSTSTSATPASSSSSNQISFNAPASSRATSASATTASSTGGIFGSAAPTGASANLTFGAAPKSTASNTGGFQFGSTIPSSTGKDTTASTASKATFTFGGNDAAPNTTASSVFGSTQAGKLASESPFGHHSHSAPSLTQLVSSAAPAFGTTTTQPAVSQTFGSSSLSSSGSTPSFSFGGASSKTTLSGSSSTFTFGQSKSNTNSNSMSKIPEFGASSQSTPAFGTASYTNTNNSSAKSSLFGQAAPSFGGTQTSTQSKSSGFQFGSAPTTTSATSTSSSPFTFGQAKSQAPASNVFGSSNTSNSSAFGSSSQNQPASGSVFGSNNQGQSTFGGASQQSSSSGFAFGSNNNSAQSSTFGSGASTAASPFGQGTTSTRSQDKPFSLGGSSGSSGGMPTPNFNFAAGNPGPSFNAQPQAQTPGFGAAPQTPNNMFSIGQGKAAPQKRATVRAQRRMPRRK